MLLHPHCRRLFILTLTFASLGSAIAAAQLFNDGVGTKPNETIQIQTGNILEILPIHSFPSATYSWILTHDRNFLEVGRNAFYSTRLINPGRFTLNAEVGDPTGQTALRRVFIIDVQPRQTQLQTEAPPPTEETPPDNSLVRTTPEKRDDGLIILPPNQALLLLTPLRDDLPHLSIDLDSQNDANNDDILTNDVDNDGTFFQTSKTPLYLWFTSPLEQRAVTVHADTPDFTPLTQTLSVLTAEYAKQRGLFVSRVQISIEEQGPKSILFSPKFEDSGTPAIPLMFRWDFGDGAESVEEQPLHEYEAYGTYNVHLSIRNLETGQELAARTVAIPLKAPLIQDPNISLPSPALPTDPIPPPHTSLDRTALIILGVAAGLAAIGFIAAWASNTVKKRLWKRKIAASPPPAKPQPSSPPPTTTTTTNATPSSTQFPSPPTPTTPPKSTSSTPNWMKKSPPALPVTPPASPPAAVKSPTPNPADAPALVPTVLTVPTFVPSPAPIPPPLQQAPKTPEPSAPQPPPPLKPSPKPTAPLPTPTPPAPPKPIPASPMIQQPVSKTPIAAPTTPPPPVPTKESAMPPRSGATM